MPPKAYTPLSLEKIQGTMGSYETPSRSDMNAVFELCRTSKWQKVTAMVHSNPFMAVAPIVMRNHITTTIMHQAITSKASVDVRAALIDFIIEHTPAAAAIKNGYGSLPLHVICQRNTKLKAKVKTDLILKLCKAYPGGIEEAGGVGQRTPLHIIFTDYISPTVTEYMLTHGGKAAFMRDKKGYLPAHVACYRHCSPAKLRMLLNANPDALHAKTTVGDTLLSLATQQATDTHPNNALIEELNSMLGKKKTTPEKKQQISPGKKPTYFLDLVEPSVEPATPPLGPEHAVSVPTQQPFPQYTRNWNEYDAYDMPSTKRFKFNHEPIHHHHCHSTTGGDIDNPEELLLNFAQASTATAQSPATKQPVARVSLEDDHGEGAVYETIAV